MAWRKSLLAVSLVAGSILPTMAFAQYAPVGVQQNVPEATVAGGGWSVCHSSTFDEIGTPLATIQADCDGTNVMLACRPVGSATFTLLAQAPRADVFTDTGTGNTPHNANGVGWYYNDDWSWGFAPQGEPLDRDTCDWNSVSVPELRMCIHTDAGATDAGYRCGDNNLNGNSAWERLVLESGGAGPGVRIGNAGENEPMVVAEELVLPPVRMIANVGGALDIITSIDYAFSPGEVRYARLSCPGIEFTPGTTVDLSGDASNEVGAVNGIGSDAVFFSITAGATPVVASDLLTIGGDRDLTGTATVDCTYSLHDQPSQAQSGSADGRIATASGTYLEFGPSYALVVDTVGNATADVESAAPAYSGFTIPSATSDPGLAQLGSFVFGTAESVLGETQPIGLDGEPVELEDLFGDDNALAFGGDFSAAGGVLLSIDDACELAFPVDAFDDDTATLTIGPNGGWAYLCYATNGEAIPEATFTVALDADPADATTFSVDDVGPLTLGGITRNGTQLQAPLVQTPNAWVSRIVLTNTGSLERAYEISVMGETGNIIGVDSTLLVGTVPANGTKVVELDDVLLSFSGDHRATLNVTVAAPDNQIQGLYQIVNPDSGSISNHVMVRPGAEAEPEGIR